jgi:tetratricopeptide (TPR) repeat protein
LFLALERTFPRSIHMLDNIALSYIYLEQPEQARIVFEKIRSIDPFYTRSIDSFMHFCLSKEPARINMLTHDLLASAKGKPEAWTALGIYYSLLNEPDKAVKMLDKAIFTDSKHLLPSVLKGNILLDAGEYALAVAAFRHVLLVDARNALLALPAFNGMLRTAPSSPACLCVLLTSLPHCDAAGVIRALLNQAAEYEADSASAELTAEEKQMQAVAIQRFREESIRTATECAKNFPAHPTAIAYYGLALLHCGKSGARSKQYFDKALSMAAEQKRMCFDAITGLVTLMMMDKQYDQAEQ